MIDNHGWLQCDSRWWLIWLLNYINGWLDGITLNDVCFSGTIHLHFGSFASRVDVLGLEFCSCHEASSDDCPFFAITTFILRDGVTIVVLVATILPLFPRTDRHQSSSSAAREQWHRDPSESEGWHLIVLTSSGENSNPSGHLPWCCVLVSQLAGHIHIYIILHMDYMMLPQFHIIADHYWLIPPLDVMNWIIPSGWYPSFITSGYPTVITGWYLH